MAVIKCKMCGGDMELTLDKTFGTCEYCGSTMTLPKVTDEQRAAAFNRGNHFRRIGEFDKALMVYERMVREDDTDAEAHWCCALCRFGIEYVEDPGTYEYIPTCHRASFDSFLEDVDYLAAIEYSDGLTRRQYQRDAVKIAEVQRGILATSQNEEPYDVFICYKETDEMGARTRDSVMAQEIYYQLTENNHRVFFSRISLEAIAGKQYEPYIFAALNSAKVMIVVGTRPEHLSAVWVKNEWSRFLAMMRKDRSKLLIPCYRDMDPYDMPEQLSVLQSYDMGKLGFMQDLTRGVSKVLNQEEKRSSLSQEIREPVIVQQSGSNKNALLKRGNMALEDCEWKKADGFFEEVLNQDAECAEAYIGKVLADKKCMNLDEFVQQILRSYEVTEPCKHIILVDESVIESAVAQYSVPRYYSESEIRQAYEMFDLTYESYVESRIQQKEDAENAWNMNRDLMRATRFADPVTAQKLNDTKKKMLETMDARTAEALEEQEKAKAEREAAYQKHLARVNEEIFQKHKEAENKRHEDYLIFRRLLENSQDIQEIGELLMRFEEMGDYLDCAELVSRCREEKVKVLERRKEEESRKEEERRKEIEKRRKEVEARRIEEARRVKQQYEERTATWRNAGVCQHCGGKFKGLFIEKCANCGRTKDY